LLLGLGFQLVRPLAWCRALPPWHNKTKCLPENPNIHF
jgi:hypothetical protein